MEEAKYKDVSVNGGVRDVIGEDRGIDEGSLVMEVDGESCNGVDRVVRIVDSEVALDEDGGLVDVGVDTGVDDDLGSRKNEDLGVKESENELGDNVSTDVRMMKVAEPAMEEGVERVAVKEEEVRGLENKLQDQAVASGLGDLVDETKSFVEADKSNKDDEAVVEFADGQGDEEHSSLHDEQLEMEIDKDDLDSEEMETDEEKYSERENIIFGNSVKAQQPHYQLQTGDEDGFSFSDLVWGKVRSHPWWPGQIFDPSDASEKAMKYHKNDCFLVAYFGDGTFAWNEASGLKPFRSYFSKAENQSSSEAFQNAVECALEEVSRRVELGLTCSCTAKDAYEKIRFQVIENAGIRKELNLIDGIDNFSGSDLFEPGKFLEYIKNLAQSPTRGASQLELVIVKSQLLAFCRSKGCCQLPEFQFSGELEENSDSLEFEEDGKVASSQEVSHARRGAYYKRKHNLKDIIYPKKKGKNASELMSDSWDSADDEVGSSPSSAKKEKDLGDDVAAPDDKKPISLDKVSTITLPKPSFKIGDCIRRVATQMTSSPSILKANNNLKPAESNEGTEYDEDVEINEECSSVSELLSKLHLAAQCPVEGSGFINVVDFFSDFRNSITIDQPDVLVDTRRKGSHTIGHFEETYEFEDMNDTYWTDRVIENGSEDTLQPPHKSRKRDSQVARVNGDESFRKSNSKRHPHGNNFDQSTEKPSKPVDYRDENAPAELLMHFPVVDSIPSEASLNRMFKRFGPLLESKTEVDRDTNRARVVFKRCADAESAHSSAQKFNIFGQILVNYQLNYRATVAFKNYSSFHI